MGTLAVLPAAGGAATITVDAESDGVPGNCELREAIHAANGDAAPIDACASGDPGLDIIDFDITGAGPHLIAPGSALPPVMEPVTIDGELTDPDEVELGGAAAGAADGLVLGAGSAGSTIRGLAVNRFLAGGPVEGDGIRIESVGNLVEDCIVGTDSADAAGIGNTGDGIEVLSSDNEIRDSVVSGNGADGVLIEGDAADGNVIQGGRIGVDSTGAALPNGFQGVTIYGNGGRADRNVVGGTAPGEGNVISGNASQGMLIDQGDENRIEGNLIGTDPTGTAARPNTIGILITGASDNRIGGVSAGAGNLISGNSFSGINISAVTGPTTGNRVEGNLIGTDATGAVSLPNLGPGVILGSGADGNAVGSSGAGNVISGNTGSGVIVAGVGTSGNAVQANLIGVGADGSTPLANGSRGVDVFQASDNLIGGTAAGTGNVIANNVGTPDAGVLISDPAATGNSILGNSIHSHPGLGIDLEGPADPPGGGVTPNDPGDADAGPNGLQNFPVLRAAVAGGSTYVSGDLDSAPGTGYRIEIFSNQMADPSGFGEGETFLGAADVTTDAGGDASFALTAAGTAPAGSSITATATELGPGGDPGSTSEFSQAIVEGPCDVDGTAAPDVLSGGPASEIICGRAGDDILRGAGGDDILLGGAGTDLASFAGGGPVTASLAAGTATGQGADRLISIERLIGSSFADVLIGDGHANFLDGRGGRDRLVGLAGADRLLGRKGPDRLLGGAGRDRFFGGAGRDRLFGGTGRDRLFGGAGPDRLLGGSGPDRLLGGAGRDRLFGTAGRDLLRGGPGRRDLCNGGKGRDRRRTRGCELVRRIP